jgi:hypothetical protein
MSFEDRIGFLILVVGFTVVNAIILGLNLKLYTEFAKERFKGK